MQTKDSEDLTRVGPGTVMGTFMRQYWIPACLSSELEADGDPVRLMLLCEKLIAFRDSEGRVGIMDHRCPHRCASLFIGRNEESGIRCVYHGWKFDVNGKCVDMPSVPARMDFKERVHAKAYKTYEANGLVWVYMGADQDSPPPKPQIEAAMHPDAEIWCLQRDCNWLQALEGDIDTSHVGFLHVGSLTVEDLEEDHPMRPTVLNRAPEYEVQQSDWGVMYGGYRPNDDGKMSWRVAHYMFPFWTQTPNNRFATRAIARAWVPIDDEHSMLFDITCGTDTGNPAYTSTLKDGTPLFEKISFKPNSTDWYGRWRSTDSEANDWAIDRDSQRNGTQFTGIPNITMQDQAVTESMGAITDHSFENLAPTDQMIARVRRRVLMAARAFAEGKAPAPGANEPEVFYGARAGSFLHDPEDSLEAAYKTALSNATRWGKAVEAAE
ncbi:phenylpropionate dioxygenase-like ring-hydroxylating dioxygenase large terminal subunit [Altererythrobacter atlanticus]|uniref:Phthalate 4,5-dioxygenase oxygenase subunit n=1 Tax=Croceibacterium atlanticum TaxID=1267766 RepID=A0A0F7KZT4_9SPHN|nr:Rieske 2Fe-2S domain-containing protein [Croceibacterium atlanticum]AKH44360.1 Phthalate 4,5-dioxygenase oxygenase subunit [Croceibacterium atlanticum]MBB5733923.1 phenylpropionate dioxygenase-like ring-hydroxylating dioxygenase large terminal subunit [Croceibacterium atlanticum]